MTTKPIPLRIAVDEYLDEMRLNGRAASYIKTHTHTLTVMQEVLGSTFDSSNLTYAHILRILERARDGDTPPVAARKRQLDMRPAGKRVATSLDTDKTALRQFLDFLEASGYHVKGRAIMRRVKTTPRSERFGKIMQILDVQDRVPLLEVAGRRHPRDRMACALGLYVGLRESSMLPIRWKDIDRTTGTIRFRNVKAEKMGQEVWCVRPVVAELQEEFDRWEAWLLTHHFHTTDQPVNPDWFLLPGRLVAAEIRNVNWTFEQFRRMHPGWPVDPMRPANSKMVSKDIRFALEGIGWENTKREGAHTLRRSCVNILEALGVAIEVIQWIVDHESPETTLTYLRHGRDKRTRRLIELYSGKRMFPKEAPPGEDIPGVVDLTKYREAAVYRDLKERLLVSVLAEEDAEGW